ncbi:mucin-5AC [Musca vetustissima]|uniref:mucin-5AC n=1 Tax=Musca vetustissima TaxID=27455 RepID=UPI002AB6F7E7|nr:mucin-5AC [Musca vetustissima]
MSCQQASRFITTTNSNTTIAVNNSTNNKQLSSTNINNSNNITRIVAAEDPYVFTESVPTTPPILFNTQKSRSRLSEIISGTTTFSLAANVQPQLQQQQITTTQTNGKLAAIKTQASYDKKSASLKNVSNQSLANGKASSATTTATTTTLNKKVTNVCIVRPQLQQQQPPPPLQHVINSSCPGLDDDLKSISPPPLYTPPTPSLWQTPLLIEAAPVAVPTPPPPTSATTALTTSSCGGGATPNAAGGGVGLSTSTTGGGGNTSTTVMAKVAPIVVQQNSTAPPTTTTTTPSCLPPSKFHNHTMAQHLQKLECLKKPKKSVTPTVVTSSSPLSNPPPSSLPFGEDLLKSKVVSSAFVEPLLLVDGGGDNLKSGKHSDNEELNEIPVNVIFRMAVMPPQQQPDEQKNDNHQQQRKKQNKITTPANNRLTTKSSLSITTTNTATTTPPPPSQNKMINRNRLAAAASATGSKNTPASEIHHTQINTSSKQQQQQPPQQSQQQVRVADYPVLETPNATPIVENTEEQSIPNSAVRKSSVNNTFHYSQSHVDTYTSGGCSTTAKDAVAIVRLSHHPNEDPTAMDISHLATATGLPYCLQHYWFNAYEFRKSSFKGCGKKLNRSALREERIACYRQQLQRQAIQLLSTRSLQKIPLSAARRRLICVDRLLRKYYKQNGRGLSAAANVLKQCTFTGCEANALEMATHCQKHIVLSAGKELFLPCTAKFADNTQCRVPVFDITHDLPLCLEHARKRDAYNRLLYEQRPRKLSAATAAAPITTTSAAASSMFIPKNLVGKQSYKQQQRSPSSTTVVIGQQQQTPSIRKRKQTGNPVGRPQKRAKKMPETTTSIQAANAAVIHPTTSTNTATHTTNQLPARLPALRRKGSTTSLESIASNSQHSTTSNTSQTTATTPQQFYSMTNNSFANQQQPSLPPPALAPLSSNGVFMANNSCLPQHLFSFGHDTTTTTHGQMNKHSSSLVSNNNSSTSAISPTTEFKDFISSLTTFTSSSSSSNQQNKMPTTSATTFLESTDPMSMNTNSNSNFTSSGMGSTTSLPTAADDFLSICENSSASSVDTGLGGLSDRELMIAGPDDDIPLGDTHLLEENDLANVLNSLPEDAFKELFATVHQDESDEIERAIELADKHLKTLQQTISSELGDFLDFSDDMLMDNGDLCSAEGVTAVPHPGMLDAASFFVGTNAPGVVGGIPTNCIGGSGGVGIGGNGVVLGSGGPTNSLNDIRGLVQT